MTLNMVDMARPSLGFTEQLPLVGLVFTLTRYSATPLRGLSTPVGSVGRRTERQYNLLDIHYGGVRFEHKVGQIGCHAQYGTNHRSFKYRFQYILALQRNDILFFLNPAFVRLVPTLPSLGPFILWTKSNNQGCQIGHKLTQIDFIRPFFSIQFNSNQIALKTKQI